MSESDRFRQSAFDQRRLAVKNGSRLGGFEKVLEISQHSTFSSQLLDRSGSAIISEDQRLNFSARTPLGGTTSEPDKFRAARPRSLLSRACCRRPQADREPARHPCCARPARRLRLLSPLRLH